MEGYEDMERRMMGGVELVDDEEKGRDELGTGVCCLRVTVVKRK